MANSAPSIMPDSPTKQQLRKMTVHAISASLFFVDSLIEDAKGFSSMEDDACAGETSVR